MAMNPDMALGHSLSQDITMAAQATQISLTLVTATWSQLLAQTMGIRMALGGNTGAWTKPAEVGPHYYVFVC